MLSVEAQELLKENGYSIHAKGSAYTISYARKPIGVYFFLLAFVLVSVPLLLIYSMPIVALLAGLVAILPAYRILKSTEVPDSVNVDESSKTLDLISFNGVKSKAILFREIRSWGVRLTEETGDANAFSENSSRVIYYLCVTVHKKTYDVFKLESVKGGDLKVLKNELTTITRGAPAKEATTQAVPAPRLAAG